MKSFIYWIVVLTQDLDDVTDILIKLIKELVCETWGFQIDT